MFNGKMKAVTFSYDDGMTQDCRLIEILNKYNLKATFNLNSGNLGQKHSIEFEGRTICLDKNKPEDVRTIYQGHEVAGHTLTHAFLPDCSDEEIIHQVEQDRINLSELAGYEVLGMAYPGGGENNTQRVADVIRKNTGIRYARALQTNHSFDLQENLYRFHPTVYDVRETDAMFELARKFIDLQPDKPQIFYVWGHTYEFDVLQMWPMIEEFCAMISNRDDIFYGTNRQILLTNNTL